MNSYALDFFKHGSEKLLIIANELSPGDTYGILLDFHFVLSSITTSIEVFVENDEKEASSDYKEFFLPLYKSISTVKNSFSQKFYKQYRGRNRI